MADALRKLTFHIRDWTILSNCGHDIIRKVDLIIEARFARSHKTNFRIVRYRKHPETHLTIQSVNWLHKRMCGNCCVTHYFYDALLRHGNFRIRISIVNFWFRRLLGKSSMVFVPRTRSESFAMTVDVHCNVMDQRMHLFCI